MEFSILKSEDFITTAWSGGTTTQLYIYPPTADYQKRNFIFRISTAKVEVEKSEFTSLPGVSRKIMILDGEITIEHQNHGNRQLKKFEPYTFKGDWKTSAVGTCTDFNVMTKNQVKSEIYALVIEEKESIDLTISANSTYFLIYIYTGIVDLKIEHNSRCLCTSNMLVIINKSSDDVRFTGIEKSELVITEIGFYN